jgi:hypothetical protein
VDIKLNQFITYFGLSIDNKASAPFLKSFSEFKWPENITKLFSAAA